MIVIIIIVTGATDDMMYSNDVNDDKNSGYDVVVMMYDR
jgi:hypothetical protein